MFPALIIPIINSDITLPKITQRPELLLPRKEIHHPFFQNPLIGHTHSFNIVIHKKMNSIFCEFYEKLNPFYIFNGIKTMSCAKKQLLINCLPLFDDIKHTIKEFCFYDTILRERKYKSNKEKLLEEVVVVMNRSYKYYERNFRYKLPSRILSSSVTFLCGKKLIAYSNEFASPSNPTYYLTAKDINVTMCKVCGNYFNYNYGNCMYEEKNYIPLHIRCICCPFKTKPHYSPNYKICSSDAGHDFRQLMFPITRDYHKELIDSIYQTHIR